MTSSSKSLGHVTAATVCPPDDARSTAAPIARNGHKKDRRKSFTTETLLEIVNRRCVRTAG
jgi:hypothetical protein